MFSVLDFESSGARPTLARITVLYSSIVGEIRNSHSASFHPGV